MTRSQVYCGMSFAWGAQVPLMKAGTPGVCLHGRGLSAVELLSHRSEAHLKNCLKCPLNDTPLASPTLRISPPGVPTLHAATMATSALRGGGLHR